MSKTIEEIEESLTEHDYIWALKQMLKGHRVSYVGYKYKYFVIEGSLVTTCTENFKRIDRGAYCLIAQWSSGSVWAATIDARFQINDEEYKRD